MADGRSVTIEGPDGEPYVTPDMPPYYTAVNTDENPDEEEKGGALELDQTAILEALARARVQGADLEILVISSVRRVVQSLKRTVVQRKLL